MASSKDFVNFIIEQMRFLGDIKVRPMMGEYLVYYKSKLVGGIYDERLLVKRTETNKPFYLPEEIPYAGAKPMYMIDDIDNPERIKEIILATYNGLN